MESGKKSALLTRASTAAMGSRNPSLGSCEAWTSDSGVTSTMTSFSEGFLSYTVKSEGRYVKTANGKLLPVVGCRQLEIGAEQPAVLVTISLREVKLERSLISERQASLMSGLLFMKGPTIAHLGTGKDVCCYFSYSPSSGLYEMTARRRKQHRSALLARAPPQHGIMEVHRLLAHPIENITRATAKATTIIRTSEASLKPIDTQCREQRTTVPWNGRPYCTWIS